MLDIYSHNLKIRLAIQKLNKYSSLCCINQVQDELSSHRLLSDLAATAYRKFLVIHNDFVCIR